jgi:DNA-binding transcriptional LysR family regulator
MYRGVMELRQLELFSVLAEEQHFGRAAQRLHVSQPALTYQIQRLEEELGLQLLRRTTRRVELTAAGTALRDGSQPLIDEMLALVERVRKVGHGEVGIVRVGCVASALHGVVPAMIRAARERHPDVEFVLIEKKTGTQLEDLASGRLDIGLIHLPANVPAGIEIQELFRQPVGLAVPDNHPVADLPVVDLRSLAGESFVLFPRALEPDTYDRFVGACVSAGFAPKVSQDERSRSRRGRVPTPHGRSRDHDGDRVAARAPGSGGRSLSTHRHPHDARRRRAATRSGGVTAAGTRRVAGSRTSSAGRRHAAGDARSEPAISRPADAIAPIRPIVIGIP